MAVDPTADIHKTAVIEDGAKVGPNCRIGPYCVVGPKVSLAADVTLHSHVAVAGLTSIGEGTEIFPFASIGHAPQDLKFGGEETQLIIGCRNRIREHVTMNPGTSAGGGETRVGDDCLFMVGVHVAHDCIVGNRVILANNATMAGHCIIEDNVIMGGLSGLHQFVRIGRGAFVGGMSAVAADVIPYGMVVGDRAHLGGLNLVGLKRAQAERSNIHGLRSAYGELFGESGTLGERVKAVGDTHAANPLVQEVIRFMTTESSRSYTLPSG